MGAIRPDLLGVMTAAIQDQLVELEACACIAAARQSRNPTVETAYANLLVAVKLAENDEFESYKHWFAVMADLMHQELAEQKRSTWRYRLTRWLAERIK